MSEQLELDLDFGRRRRRPGAWLVRSPQKMVQAFHEATGAAVDERTYEVVNLRHKLVKEEFHELQAEITAAMANLACGRPIEPRTLAKIAKEGSDLMYVVLGTFVSLGIDGMLAFRRVHESNMSKLVDGKAELRYDGKVLKGPNYFEPDMTGTYNEGSSDV